MDSEPSLKVAESVKSNKEDDEEVKWEDVSKTTPIKTTLEEPANPVFDRRISHVTFNP